MIEALPKGLLGVRDRALLLVGFAAALRRAELVALDVAHVAWHREGIIVHVARSKTDQLGAGADVPMHASEGMSRRYIRQGTAFERDPLRGMLDVLR